MKWMMVLLLTFLFPTVTNGVEIVEHKKFVIAVAPKCGTHFIQSLVYFMTGKLTTNKHLSANSLREAEENNQIFRISRAYDTTSVALLKKKHYKVLTMFRDPRDALISHLFYMREKAHEGLERDFFTVSSNFDALSFDEQLSALITGLPDMASYLRFYERRMPWILDVYCYPVRFEDLLPESNGGDAELQRETVKGIAKYLGITLSEEKLQFVLNNMYHKTGDVATESGVFIRATSGNWKKFFKPEHKELFKKHSGKLLVRLGYEKNNKW